MVNRHLKSYWRFIILLIAITALAACEENADLLKETPAPEKESLFAQAFSYDPKVGELADAAGTGNIKKINRLVKAGVDPNGSPLVDDFFTPLGWATIVNNKAGMKRLLDLGADPNKSFGVPDLRNGKLKLVMYSEPISVAKDIEAIKLLLEHGADPNGKMSMSTPLISHISNIEIVKLLIAYGADVNLPYRGILEKRQPLDNGEVFVTPIIVTPLPDSIGGRSLEVTKLLLDHGANTDLDRAYSRLKQLMRRDLEPEQRKLALELEYRIYEMGGRYFPPFSREEMHIKGLRFDDEKRKMDLKPGVRAPDIE